MVIRCVTCPSFPVKQIKDLNSGTFGFVQLCRNKNTREQVAIKFIERGDKVGSLGGQRVPALRTSPAFWTSGFDISINTEHETVLRHV